MDSTKRCKAWLIAALAVLLPDGGIRGETRCGPEQDVIATYEGGAVTAAELEGRLPADVSIVAGPAGTARVGQILEDLILNELLLGQGRCEGLDHDPVIEARVDELRRRLIIQRVLEDLQSPEYIPQEAVQSYYDGHAEAFSTAAVRVRQLRVSQRDQAVRLLKELQQDPQSFERLAAQHSETRSAARGGEVGWIARGQLAPELEQAAFSLRRPGEFSGVQQSPAGYHLFQLIERQEGEPQPLASVAPQIRAILAKQRFDAALEQLRRAGNIVIDETALQHFIASHATVTDVQRQFQSVAPRRDPVVSGD